MGKADIEALNQRIAEGEEKERQERRKEMSKKVKEKRNAFFKDFKAFITKGNVLDLAVAVVVGGAFNTIVNGLVKYIINPFVSIFMPQGSLENLKTVINYVDADKVKHTVADYGAAKAAGVDVSEWTESAILWGEWIQTIINFLIIALTIFVVVRVIKKTEARLHARELEEKAAADAAKKAEEKAAAEAAAKEAARKEEALEQFYANVARQTALLEEISKK